MAIQMAKKIYKYDVPLVGRPAIVMKKGAEIIHVEEQHGIMRLWAVVDPRAEEETRNFTIVGTGHDMPKNYKVKHVGSLLTEGGAFVWHLFEEG